MFHYQSDNIVMNFLSKAFDLMFLGILWFVCCLPVVTIGASLSALHRVAAKILDDHGSGIFREFICAFRENFRTATVSWLPLLVGRTDLLCSHLGWNLELDFCSDCEISGDSSGSFYGCGSVYRKVSCHYGRSGVILASGCAFAFVSVLVFVSVCGGRDVYPEPHAGEDFYKILGRSSKRRE